jgi:hypothetical protein
MSMKATIMVVAFVALMGTAFAVNPSDYFPLEVGRWWLYLDSTTTGIDTSYTLVAGTAMMEGRETFIMTETHLDGSVDTTYDQIRSDGIYALIKFGEESGFRDMFIVPNPVNIGDRWTMLIMDTTWVDSSSIYTYHTDYHFTGLAEAWDDIIVPRGSFDNCFKWKMEFNYHITVSMGGTVIYNDSSNSSNVMWLAYGVGPVKEISNMDSTSGSLIDYGFAGIADKGKSAPREISISAYPNPFNSACRIECPIGASIQICDMNGKVVREFDGLGILGKAGFVWQPENLESGIYFVKAISALGSQTSRLFYLK